MRCSRFEKQVSDYVAGRLAGTALAAMEEHASTCAACRMLEQEEAAFRSAFAALPTARRTPNVTAAVLAKIETPERVVVRRTSLRWAFAGVMAAACAMVVFSVKPAQQAGISDQNVGSVQAKADETAVIQLVADRRMQGHPEADPTLQEGRQYTSDMRRVLVGGGE
jgi:anti-sigma factor RsiW